MYLCNTAAIGICWERERNGKVKFEDGRKITEGQIL